MLLSLFAQGAVWGHWIISDVLVVGRVLPLVLSVSGYTYYLMFELSQMAQRVASLYFGQE